MTVNRLLKSSYRFQLVSLPQLLFEQLARGDIQDNRQDRGPSPEGQRAPVYFGVDRLSALSEVSHIGGGSMAARFCIAMIGD
jgi:hypothetical protein